MGKICVRKKKTRYEMVIIIFISTAPLAGSKIDFGPFPILRMAQLKPYTCIY